MAVIPESPLQEVWRSSHDLIMAPTDKASWGSWKQIRKADEWVQEAIGRFNYYFRDGAREERCSSVVVQRVKAPVSVVWSLVRRFEEPQIYKKFVRNCFMHQDLRVGCVREIRLISGLPATTSTERLDILDEERHIVSFSIVGGDHRLNNYRSITSVQESVIDGKAGSIVMESYMVDVADGNTKEETRMFTNKIIKSNLQSLANISHRLTTIR